MSNTFGFAGCCAVAIGCIIHEKSNQQRIGIECRIMVAFFVLKYSVLCTWYLVRLVSCDHGACPRGAFTGQLPVTHIHPLLPTPYSLLPAFPFPFFPAGPALPGGESPGARAGSGR